MTDTTQPSQEPNGKPPEEANGDAADEHRQDTFAVLFQQLADQFGKACEDGNIGTAVFILEHPDAKQPPAVFVRGHILEAASITADFLRSVKAKIYRSLDTEPR